MTSNPNIIGPTAANVRGWSLWGNLWACHFAQSNGLVGAFNSAGQSGGVIAHHQMNNYGAAIGMSRDACPGMFTSRSGGAMSSRFSDHIRGHMKNAFPGRGGAKRAGEPMNSVAPVNRRMDNGF